MRSDICEPIVPPCPIATVFKPSNSSDHQAMSNLKPPFGPVGLRRQEGPERVQAHTNNGGNCVHSARSWDGAEELAPLFSQHADSWWFRTRVVQERGRSGRSSTGTLQQTYPNSSIHEMAEWIMTDPEQGLGLASLYNHLPLHGHPPLPG